MSKELFVGGSRALIRELSRLAQRVPTARIWLEQAIAPRLVELAESVLEVTLEIGDPLGSVFAGLLESADIELLDHVCERTDTALDQYSTSLLDIAVVAAHRLLYLRAQEWPQPKPEECAELGRLALNLAVRLTNRQTLAEAESWARESVTLLSSVAENDPNQFLGHLLHSLSTLGSILVQSGKHTEALQALDPVVRLLQRSARESPELRVLLASSLNSFGLAQQGAGHSNDESLRSFEESVAVYRELAPGKPATWIGLGSSLYNLIGSLKNIGNLERALSLASDTTELAREYTSFRADIFLPILALSLDVQAQALREACRWRDALACQVESTAVYRELATAHSRAFLHSLARGLIRQGMLRGELGTLAEGIADLREAVEIFKALSSQVLVLDRIQLADACDQLALLLHFQGGRGALGLSRRATNLYRRLSGQEPGVPRLAGLARSLNHLGVILRGRGRLAESLRSLREAVSLYHRLERRTGVYRWQLVASLVNLGLTLASSRRVPSALRVLQSAVALGRSLPPNRPEFPLARALRSLGNVLVDIGKWEQAIDSYQEARAVYLAAPHLPKDAQFELARCLFRLGSAQRRLLRFQEALDSFEAAIGYLNHPEMQDGSKNKNLSRALAELSRAATLEKLGRREEARLSAERTFGMLAEIRGSKSVSVSRAMALDTLAGVLLTLGFLQEAEKAVRQALTLYRRFARHAPLSFGFPLAFCLGVAAAIRLGRGRPNDALSLLAEAAKVMVEGGIKPFEESQERLQGLAEIYQWACVAAGQRLDLESERILLQRAEPVLALAVETGDLRKRRVEILDDTHDCESSSDNPRPVGGTAT